MSVLAAQQDERLVLEKPGLYFGFDGLQLKFQLLLGDPQATATGCWKREKHPGSHGLPDPAGVLLGLAHPPSGCLTEYPASEPPASEPRRSLPGLGFGISACLFLLILLHPKKFFSGFSRTYLPHVCTKEKPVPALSPLSLLDAAMTPGLSSQTTWKVLPVETFKQGWE